jgi:hypothetical protein
MINPEPLRAPAHLASLMVATSSKSFKSESYLHDAQAPGERHAA